MVAPGDAAREPLVRDAREEERDYASFQPDTASPPGDTISDLLEQRGLTGKDLAGWLGRDEAWAATLLSGAAPVDLKVATTLSDRLGGSVRFWLRRESFYVRDLERLEKKRGER